MGIFEAPCILAFCISKKSKLWGFPNKIFSWTGNSVKFCVLFCLAWDYSFVSGSQLRLVVLVSCVQLLCFRRAGTHFSSIHHWIDQQKLMALNILVKSWKIFWFRLYSGHFKQSGKNNLCLLNYFIVKISVPRRMLRKNETYSKTS